MPVDWIGFVGPHYNDWYESDTTAELNGITVARLRSDLAALKPNEDFVVNLSTEGGLTDVGLSIMNLIHAESVAKRLQNPLFQSIVNVIGTAYSAGSIICQGFDKCIMCTGSEMMIHRASMVAWGNTTDFIKNAEFLKGVDERICAVFMEKSGKKLEEIMGLLDNETFLSANEAIGMGLASECSTLSCKVAPVKRDYTSNMRRSVRMTEKGSLAFFTPKSVPTSSPSASSIISQMVVSSMSANLS